MIQASKTRFRGSKYIYILGRLTYSTSHSHLRQMMVFNSAFKSSLATFYKRVVFLIGVVLSRSVINALCNNMT